MNKMDQSSTQCRGFFNCNTGGWRELADGEKYWRMERNTGRWQETLADGEKHWRMARNTGG
jgi:hypothetical protein